eukprot:CAMPEP_0197553578 /NCGR_PEP_ID=MMETSP1320-20131121/9315_1 /TAXON_ID=91990 /ORGANISM="Bolidomonas sp., Strain RCC2347" /LENGTH=326 /DNA_ID=CAMNT_0043114355 /DNA_START=344 /DNA_END=1320 /DNA_ORIENTATION=-
MSNAEVIESPDPAVLKLARTVVIGVIATVIELGMNSYGYNKYTPVPSPEYDALLRYALKPHSKTLLTVSNHCCTLDDPILFGCILPPSHKWDHRYHRWSLCSQEICFKHPLSAAFFGAGKVMPIKRGDGVDQPLLLQFCQRAAKPGSWVHLFPEGKIFQSGSVGSLYFNARPPAVAADIGKLKWGVGKVVAHCPNPVALVPLHHVGMEGVVPQRSDGELRTYVPQPGNEAVLRVGREVYVDDIIEEWEAENGKLWKYGESGAERWESTRKEKELYSKIARRVEEALEDLEREAKADTTPGVVEGYRRIGEIKVFNEQEEEREREAG